MSYILDTPYPSNNIFLRSSLCTSSGSSGSEKYNLTFELNKPILCDPGTMDLLININSFQFTNTFYTVNEYNNKLYYVYESMPFSYNTVTLTMGNYNIDTLISHLNTLLTGLFTFSYNVTSYKITMISLNGPFKLIDLDGQYKNIYEVLGFNDAGTSPYSTSVTSPYMYNLMSVQTLHICVNNLTLDNLFVRNTPRHSILASIHITSTFGDTQVYFNNNNFQYKISDSLISQLNIIILDQDFNPVNFNNIDWFLQMSISYIYKKELKLTDSLEQHHEKMTLANEVEYNNPADEYLIENEDNNILEEISKELNI